MTNTEFIKNFMEFGSPTNQLFIIDAALKLAENIIKNEDEILKGDWSNPFVSPGAWVYTAKDFIAKYNKMYNPDKEADDFVPHGSYTISNAGGYLIQLSDCGTFARVRDAFGSDTPETSDWLEITDIIDQSTGESFPVIDPDGYNINILEITKLQ